MRPGTAQIWPEPGPRTRRLGWRRHRREVVQERLEREHDLSLILSAPSVRYRIVMNDDSEVWIDNKEIYEKALGFVRNVM